jgi:hypothetical protein
MSVLGQPKNGGLYTQKKSFISHKASQTKSMRRRWARHMERREEEKSKLMIFVGNLKKEGTCSDENCVWSFVVTAVNLDFLSTSGRQVTNCKMTERQGSTMQFPT